MDTVIGSSLAANEGYDDPTTGKARVAECTGSRGS